MENRFQQNILVFSEKKVYLPGRSHAFRGADIAGYTQKSVVPVESIDTLFRQAFCEFPGLVEDAEEPCVLGYVDIRTDISFKQLWERFGGRVHAHIGLHTLITFLERQRDPHQDQYLKRGAMQKNIFSIVDQYDRAQVAAAQWSRVGWRLGILEGYAHASNRFFYPRQTTTPSVA